ncbi:MAG TPA: hypothetical protein VGG39_16000 [Polyangiaceae bacterium]
MRYRALAATPAILVLATLVAWAVSPGAARVTVLTAAVEAAKVLAMAGCILAASAFEPGEYMRRAWALLGACTLLLFARDIVALANGPAAAQGLLAIVGNGSSVAGTWMLARAWTVAGLAEEDRPAGRVAVLAGAAALALVVTGGPLLADVRALIGGHLLAIVPFASDVADAAVLILLAPLLQTTLALRGGALRWPWALMTAGNLLWLLFDVVYAIEAAWGLPVGRGHFVTDSLRVLATAFLFSAGLAQRWAVLPQTRLEAVS